MGKRIGLRESQEIAKKILDIVVDICDRFDLRYYLMYGTLIGAVRHQDFIPWDDDLDIMMPREDYNRLLEIIKKNPKLLKGMKLFDPTLNDNYPYMIGRVSNPNYKIVMDNEKPYGMGLFIDIYPFDGLGNSFKNAINKGIKGDHLSSLLYQSSREKCKIEVTKSFFRKIIKYPTFKISKLIGSKYFKKQIFKLEKENLFSFDNSKYVGCLVWLSGGKKDIFYRDWFGKGKMAYFGKKKYRIPNNSDKVLTHIYGDYMKLPPKKDRVGHHNYYVIKRENNRDE